VIVIATERAAVEPVTAEMVALFHANTGFVVTSKLPMSAPDGMVMLHDWALLGNTAYELVLESVMVVLEDEVRFRVIVHDGLKHVPPLP
jgi:hypothetical protein